MRFLARSFTRSSLVTTPVRSRRGAEIAGWLFLFGLSGTMYLFSVASNTWFWVQMFAGLLFLMIGLGILWDWMVVRRPPLNARNVILCGVLFWLLLDPLLMREGLDDFSPAIVLKALLYAAIFLIAVWVGYLVRPFVTVSRFFSRIPHDTNDDLMFLVTVAIFLIGIVPLITAATSVTELWRLLLAGYSPDVEVGWRRGMLGDRQDFYKSIARLFQLTIPFLGTYLLRRPLSAWKKGLLILMMSSLFIIIFFSGERRIFALIVLGPLFYIFFATSTKALKKWSMLFLASVLILFWLMQAQVQFRSAGFYDFDATAVKSNPLEMHRDNNFYWFATAVDTMPNMYEFTNEWVFLQIFTHPIPRFLWPEKPYSTGLPFVQWEETGASLSISVVGELYVGQGILGIIIGGLIYGWLARHWDELRRYLSGDSASGLVYALGLTLLLIGVRSFGDIVLNWYVLAQVVLVLRFLGRRRRDRSTPMIWLSAAGRSKVSI